MATVKQVEQALREREAELGRKVEEVLRRFRELRKQIQAAQEEYANLRGEQKLAQQALEIFLGAVESVPYNGAEEDEREPEYLVCSDCGFECCGVGSKTAGIFTHTPCTHFEDGGEGDGCSQPGCTGHNIPRSEYEARMRKSAEWALQPPTEEPI